MIEVQELTKRYGATLAVDRVSFEAREGEVLGLLGPNAAGKTTTMRVITGYLSPTSGTARVAGFDKAVYGLPAETYPILFELPASASAPPTLIATTKLSQFITARYAPSDAWRDVWQMILRWLGDGDAAQALHWTPAVRPTLRLNDKLPNDIELVSVRRGEIGRASCRERV